MKPHSHEEHIQHTFDAFCKKVLRNEARDYLDELARKRNREIIFSDLPVEVMEQLSTCDIYFVEKQSFGVLDYRVHMIYFFYPMKGGFISMSTAINQKTNVPVVREYKIGDMTYIVKAVVKDGAKEDAATKIRRMIRNDMQQAKSHK